MRWREKINPARLAPLRRSGLTGVLVAAGLLAFSVARAEVQVTTYEPDPRHLWNRLYAALEARTDEAGKVYGVDELDPLLWSQTRHLTEGQSYRTALAVLDEFIDKHGEKLEPDPLKRALLQRDLWAVFDWMILAPGRTAAEHDARVALRNRLALLIKRLALTKDQIAALPDNYEAAVASKQYAASFDGNKTNDTPFLPANLFSNGPWVCVGSGGEQRIAPMHVASFGGRSAFLVFMATPGGRGETTAYLQRLIQFQQPYLYQRGDFNTNYPDAVLNPDLPVFPRGTEFALVRQSLLIDNNGNLETTHLTESVQIRHYNDTNHERGAFAARPMLSQSVAEFVLSRVRLFGGVAGGLRATTLGEKRFRQFDDIGLDSFENSFHPHEPLEKSMIFPLVDCGTCHGRGGLPSALSFVQAFSPRGVLLPYLHETQPEAERRNALDWKKARYGWGLLQGLWASRHGSSRLDLRAALP